MSPGDTPPSCVASGSFKVCSLVFGDTMFLNANDVPVVRVGCLKKGSESGVVIARSYIVGSDDDLVFLAPVRSFCPRSSHTDWGVPFFGRRMARRVSWACLSLRVLSALMTFLLKVVQA